MPMHHIASPDWDFVRTAQARQNSLIKPQGALGRLEELACWFAARQGRTIPVEIVPSIVVFAADHGVSAQGVSAYPAAVTAQMLAGLGAGIAAINVLARAIDAPISIVDVGVALTTPTPSGSCNESIARGTRDLTQQAAMSQDQAKQALDIGARYASNAIAQGSNLLIAGEVGIGNTTSAACLVTALTSLDADLIVGHGTGLNELQRAHKVAMVRRALARTRALSDPLALLAELGGFEIAAMAGFYLQAARQRVPCLLDGFIASAAALVGCRLDAGLSDWLVASHASQERGHAAALASLRLTPLIDFSMRLGEGSGAALVVPLIQAAIKLHAQMATFEEAGVATAS